MKEYTKKEIKELTKNPYTLRVTKNKLYHTAKFKEDFWIKYQAGESPRKIIVDLGYDVKIFKQKRIDSLVQQIKKAALAGNGFTEGENRKNRPRLKPVQADLTQESFSQMQHELLYLRQEVEFLKKITKDRNIRQRQ